MEARGLIVGKIEPVIMGFSIVSMLAVCIVMILAGASFILVIPFFGMVFYIFYFGLFVMTKYYIDENGIKIESLISCYNKAFCWSDVMIIEEAILNYTNRGRGGFGEYYIISTIEEIERERGLMEMMKHKTVLCVPVTKKTKACIEYFALINQLSIIRKRYR